MKIAITGGAGFIGSRIAKEYLDAGHAVLVIDNLANGSEDAIDPRARFYNVDIRDSKIRTILKQERPEIVSHHAVHRGSSLPSEQAMIDADVNIRGFLHLLDCCVDSPVKKIIFASNGNDLYGDVTPNQNPLSETTLLAPRRSLDISKAAGESYVRYYTRQYGLEHTILRYADVYGEEPWNKAQHPLSYFIKEVSQHRRPLIQGTGAAIRDQIFIDDVVLANLAALERGKNQTLHISSGSGASLNQLFTLVASYLGSDLTPNYTSGSLCLPEKITMDNTCAQESLHWFPRVSLADGVKRSILLLNRAEGLSPIQQDIYAYAATEAVKIPLHAS